MRARMIGSRATLRLAAADLVRALGASHPASRSLPV